MTKTVKSKKTIEGMLLEINSKLDDSEKGLPGINDKLDALTADMFQVQKLADATHELLTHYVDKHEKQITEIRKKVNITTTYD